MRDWISAVLLTATCSAAQAGETTDPAGLADSFLSGEAAALWDAATPEMRAAFGSPERLATMRQDLMERFGAQTEVLSERTDTHDGWQIFSRTMRWSEAPGAMIMTLSIDPKGHLAGMSIAPGPVAAPSRHLDRQTRARLHLPFEGEWRVIWGGRDIADNYHAVDPAQRFAIDVLVMKNGSSHAGDPARLESYHCWGRQILAPAAATVVVAEDSLPDQAIGTMDPIHPAGNHVMLDFGNGEFGLLAHLQQGSLSVLSGDRITAGAMVGRCGNSGNSSEPHLHFHLQTTARLGTGEGLPAQFLDYLADGTRVPRGEPLRGQSIRPVD